MLPEGLWLQSYFDVIAVHTAASPSPLAVELQSEVGFCLTLVILRIFLYLYIIRFLRMNAAYPAFFYHAQPLDWAAVLSLPRICRPKPIDLCQ